ncbi:hypothetical protein [Streptosporangium sp. NBC_01756]|uniref:hypothetical protein n=1 Tax=Streptosporangium sp. NBC_01756 TaxID=2975950 RepID=UPI002DDAF893|nr:hypothetical protein [Streptosporangium sp. NBC_01756]WSC87705.1 hypothetical protein OIE48_05690 [Streptosporangium sp. NBC_01756]
MSTDTATTDRWGVAPVNAEVPDRVLVSVKAEVTEGDVNGWAVIYCEYSRDDDSGNDFYYTLQIRSDGRARIRKTVGKTGWDLTPDVAVPGFGKGGVALRAECARGDGRVRVALWAGESLLAEVEDTETKSAVGRPRFGLTAGQGGGSAPPTRAYFDDFEIGRLP